MTVEDRLRATSLAITDTMREVRPLTLPPSPDPAAARRRRLRRPRRWPPAWPGWLVPLAAAVAVIAVASTLVAVRGLTTARLGPDMTSANGIPGYYVSLKDAGTSPKGAVERNAFLADTSTGKRLATFKPPSDALFTYAVGSSDGRTFVLQAVAGPGFGPAGNVKLVTKGGTDLWYVVRVTPGAAQPARMTRIPITPSSYAGLAALDLALSPDGSTLAIFSMTEESFGKVIHPRPQMLQLRTYSVATGKRLRSWTAPISAWEGTPDRLSWLDDGRTLAFVAPTNGLQPFYVRTLNTTEPGTSLVASSRRLFSLPTQCDASLLVPDGKSVICGTGTFFPGAKPACNKGGIRLAVYSVKTGKLERVLYRYSGNCSWGTALMVWAKSGTLAIAAIVVTKTTAGHPQISHVVAAAGGTVISLPVTTWNGYGSIAF